MERWTWNQVQSFVNRQFSEAGNGDKTSFEISYSNREIWLKDRGKIVKRISFYPIIQDNANVYGIKGVSSSGNFSGSGTPQVMPKDPLFNKPSLEDEIRYNLPVVNSIIFWHELNDVVHPINPELNQQFFSMKINGWFYKYCIILFDHILILEDNLMPKAVLNKHHEVISRFSTSRKLTDEEREQRAIRREVLRKERVISSARKFILSESMKRGSNTFAVIVTAKTSPIEVDVKRSKKELKKQRSKISSELAQFIEG